jgi:hypothetical protein
MDMMRERVAARFGVTLQTEIRTLGFSSSPLETEAPLEMAGAR